MTTHQCPKCELRFAWLTEVDDHCRNDHPDFHHEYPVGGVHHTYEERPTDQAAPAETSPTG